MKDYNILEKLNLFNENIRDLSLYLTSLYIKTGGKYYCSRTKVNKLLTIYKLCATKYNNSCLEQEFVIIEDHFIIFPKLSAFVPFDVYEKKSCLKEDNKEINDKFDEGFQFNKLLYGKPGQELSIYSKELVENVFRKFGNYKNEDLLFLFKEIKEKIPLIKTTNGYKIDIENYDNFLDLKIDNEIFNFIKNYQIKEKEESVKVKRYKKH